MRPDVQAMLARSRAVLSQPNVLRDFYTWRTTLASGEEIEQYVGGIERTLDPDAVRETIAALELDPMPTDATGARVAALTERLAVSPDPAAVRFLTMRQTRAVEDRADLPEIFVAIPEGARVVYRRYTFGRLVAQECCEHRGELPEPPRVPPLHWYAVGYALAGTEHVLALYPTGTVELSAQATRLDEYADTLQTIFGAGA